MQFIADFHIHSKYSRATSRLMDVENLSRFAKIKGLTLLGTGDFTHPLYLKELKQKLTNHQQGLFKYNDVYFMLTTEINNIYSQDGKARRIHNIITAPDFDVVDALCKKLSKYGSLLSDGRPIVSISSKALVEIVLDISEDCLIIPSHIWTPHFSLFGSVSGFDDVAECFGEYTKFIYALETGLSSDPAMNWRLSKLDRYVLLSNSDSHSPTRIGREANVFNCPLDYFEIINAIKNKDKNKIISTLEFFPEEGKYHYDGHRKCNVSFKPAETRKNKNICPVCGKPLTIGVMSRVEELADRCEGYIPENCIPFKNIVPLDEIISSAIGKEVGTQSVESEYKKIISKFGNELDVLLNYREIDMRGKIQDKILDGILRVRNKKVKITPGYDGEYGKVEIFPDKEKEKSQMSLF